MSSQIKVTELAKFVEIETYIHATESMDKVVEAIERNLLQGENLPLVFELLWGLHGDPIVRVHVFTSDSSVAERVFLNTVCRMTNLDRLLATLDLRTDKAGNLYIRINKQQLVLDKVVLDDESDDIVRIKVRLNRKTVRDKEKLARTIEERCIKYYDEHRH